MASKPVARFIAGARNVRLSYVSETAHEAPGQSDFNVRKWTLRFAKRLQLLGIGATVDDDPGLHDAEQRTTGSETDLLIVYTVDCYDASLSPRVQMLLEGVNNGLDLQLWLARYHMDEYEFWATQKAPRWHVLSGRGADGERFLMPSDQFGASGWEDDQARAAACIRDPTRFPELHGRCIGCDTGSTDQATA